MLRDCIQIKQQILEETLFVRGMEALHYQIHYPRFLSNAFGRSLVQINRYYQQKACSYQQHCRTVLYAQAAEQILCDPAGQFPAVPYEAVVDFSVPYCENGVVSLYCDRYEFLGGAHGNTVRSSDTWSLFTGRRLPVSAFIAKPLYPKTYLIDRILEQIPERIEAGEAYFLPYEGNVIEAFREENYCLTPKGLVMYYPLYSIAPYSSGIPTFLIPYSKVVQKPHCGRRPSRKTGAGRMNSR